MDEALAQALRNARSAPVAERINYRDPIARHGAAGIEAVTPWLADRDLGWFAAQVIWKAGDLGERDAAVSVLREALNDPSVAMRRDDTAMLLGKLGYRPPRPPNPRSGPQSIPQSAGRGWPGFQRYEFGITDGTHWRGRRGEASLIPHLLRPLREIDRMFDSWPIYHSPEVHFAVRDRYIEEGDPTQRWRAAKLVVYAHGPNQEDPHAKPQATAGLYIEKGDGGSQFGPTDDRWDWPEFVRLLRQPSFRSSLERLMALHGLQIGDYWAGSRFFAGAANTEFVAMLDGDGLRIVRGGETLGHGWDALSELIEALPEDRWQDLHIWRSWMAEEAIDAKVAFARESLLPVLTDLATLYLQIVAPHRAR